MNRRRQLLRRAARKLLPARWLGGPGVGALLGVETCAGHLLDRVDGLQVEYSLDSLLGQLLYLHGNFEESESRFMRDRWARLPGGVVLDVGANIGLHSLQAARLAGVAEVHAFEPARSTFAMLQRNVARNGLAGKISTHPLAVAAGPGRAEFHFCTDDAYSSLTPDDRRPVQQTYPVEVTSLDTWARLRGLARVDFIKIDVEGGEGAVLEGAQELLARHHPELVVEIYQGHRENFSAAGLVDGICARGYDAFVLVHGAPVAFTRHDDAHFNYYFQPKAARP